VPIGKTIYNQMSKRHGRKQEKIEGLNKKKKVAPVPPTVHQFKKNETTLGSSINLHITELAKTGLRLVSPNEGMPAVNGKSGPEVVKKAVAKVKSKVKEVSPTSGVIKSSQKRCSQCKKTGHTKRACPN